jgi:hypothetical protein
MRQPDSIGTCLRDVKQLVADLCQHGRARFERNRNLPGMNGFGNAQKVVPDVRHPLRLGGHGSSSLNDALPLTKARRMRRPPSVEAPSQRRALRD